MSKNKCAAIIALPWRDPLTAFAPLCDEPYALLFGPGNGDDSNARWSILLARPSEVYETSGPGALGALPSLSTLETPQPLPFVGGYAGLASYELGATLDQVPRLSGGNWPDLAFGDYPCAAVFDHQTRSLWAVGPDKQKATNFARLLGDENLKILDKPETTRVLFLQSQEKCEQNIKRTMDYIRAGDIFQANISQKFRIKLGKEAEAFSYFRHLCEQSPAPYSAFFRRSENQVLISNSPEQFFSLMQDGQVQTSPIKGTRPRGQNAARDNALAEELLLSAKDRSENLMIVDLMRNDLSRVCDPGSIQVSELCALKSFANVHHLVSTIKGQLAPDKNALDVLAACFPAGSITGAPKIRAMEIIAELENGPRGPYCGSLGYISRHGTSQFNVLIRSAEHTTKEGQSQLDFRTGGGIIADSDPALEYQEMLDKALALWRAAGGVK